MGSRKPKNLLLDSQTVAEAELYARKHGTSLSRIVEDHLRTLPRLDQPVYDVQSPIVAELYGMAVVSEKDAEQQREFLARWRRQRGKT